MGSGVQAVVSVVVANTTSVAPTTRLRTVNDIEVAARLVGDEKGLDQCCSTCAGAPVCPAR